MAGGGIKLWPAACGRCPIIPGGIKSFGGPGGSGLLIAGGGIRWLGTGGGMRSWARAAPEPFMAGGMCGTGGGIRSFALAIGGAGGGAGGAWTCFGVEPPAT